MERTSRRRTGRGGRPSTLSGLRCQAPRLRPRHARHARQRRSTRAALLPSSATSCCPCPPRPKQTWSARQRRLHQSRTGPHAPQRQQRRTRPMRPWRTMTSRWWWPVGWQSSGMCSCARRHPRPRLPPACRTTAALVRPPAPARAGVSAMPILSALPYGVCRRRVGEGPYGLIPLLRLSRTCGRRLGSVASAWPLRGRCADPMPRRLHKKDAVSRGMNEGAERGIAPAPSIARASAKA